MKQGNILEKIRKQYGMNKNKFCKLLGICNQNYSRYLSEASGLGYDKAKKIAKTLGITINDIEDNKLVGDAYYKEKEFVEQAMEYNKTHPIKRKILENFLYKFNDHIEEYLGHN